MQPPLPLQLYDADSGDRIAELMLDWMPHPGSHVNVDDRTYAVLEKRHQYQLHQGKYELRAMRAYARPVPSAIALHATETGIGDVTCQYNARSPLLRCAVHPLGLCDICPDRESLPS
ncbi:MAG: DUF6464 family protein [Cyanobacteria bacterium P01_F01_bin.33]